jgi:hypothetical protein
MVGSMTKAGSAVAANVNLSLAEGEEHPGLEHGVERDGLEREEREEEDEEVERDEAYTDQVERDFAAITEAAAAGRLPVDCAA